MDYRKILLLIILAAATLVAYGTHLFLKKRIDPRRSFAAFLLYITLNLLSVFILVFIFGFFIIHFKDFFFKK